MCPFAHLHVGGSSEGAVSSGWRSAAADYGPLTTDSLATPRQDASRPHPRVRLADGGDRPADLRGDRWRTVGPALPAEPSGIDPRRQRHLELQRRRRLEGLPPRRGRRRAGRRPAWTSPPPASSASAERPRRATTRRNTRRRRTSPASTRKVGLLNQTRCQILIRILIRLDGAGASHA